jgi:hypothetical protein
LVVVAVRTRVGIAKRDDEQIGPVETFRASPSAQLAGDGVTGGGARSRFAESSEGLQQEVADLS